MIFKSLLISSFFISSLIFAEPINTGHAEVSLVKNTQISSNGIVHIGIKMDMQEGWHTYWLNPGDSGGAIDIEWILSDESDVSDVIYPTPHRIPYPPLMTFGYEDEVVLLTKISTSAASAIPLNLNAQVSWYTCKEICIPQEAEVSIPIKLGSKTPSASKGLLTQTLGKVPVEFNGTYRVNKLDDSYVLQGEFEKMDQYDSMYFFPKEYGLINYTENQQYEKNKDTFSLQIMASEVTIEKESFKGVIAVNKNEEVNFIEIDYPLATKEASQEFNILTLIVFAFLGGLILNLSLIHI